MNLRPQKAHELTAMEAMNFHPRKARQFAPAEFFEYFSAARPVFVKVMKVAGNFIRTRCIFLTINIHMCIIIEINRNKCMYMARPCA